MQSNSLSALLPKRLISKQKGRFLKYNLSLLIWKQMKDTKNQKLQNFQYPVRKGKLQNFGLNHKTPKRFFFREEPQGIIAYDSLTFSIFFINKTSKEILLLIEENLNKTSIVEIISKKYKISKDKSSRAVNLIWREFK